MKRLLRYGAATAAGALLLLWLFCLPQDLFEGVSYSTVVTDRNGTLLGARLARDEQWRFPPCDSLPDKFVTALIEFEDRTFYDHPGVSLRALGRAVMQNLRNGRVVSGGSTITMQVIRLSRRKPRTLWQKAVEIFMATRLEWRYSKEEILRLYASHAPFGGNVVGFDAALWRYLGHDGSHLSWAEAATLAVLQNAPSSMHPSKNRDALCAKRNRLLTRLFEAGHLSEEDYRLALDEPLIDQPYPMPQEATHLVSWYHRTHPGERIVTSIDALLQQQVEEVTTRHSRTLRKAGVRDLSAVIFDIERGDVVAYCGNSDMSYEREGRWIDIARAPRSSGSILKPLLYAAALQEGTLTPEMLLVDVPTDFGGFSPKNYHGSYDGAVPANEALIRSLNMPYVHLLKEYGTMRFAELLQVGGMTSLDRPADRYGLSLALGGAEVTLYDVTRFYARMVAVYHDSTRYADFPLRDRVALHHTFETMRELNRPDHLDWRRAQSVQQVAWKTGTSYGARDAWAIGCTPRYVVGVWCGKADGSGVAEMTGAQTAGPVMFDLVDLLPASGWFEAPQPSEGVWLPICRHSGYPAGHACCDTLHRQLPRAATRTRACPYCQEVNVSYDGAFRVVDRSQPTHIERRFALPPILEHYYRQCHPEYQPLPPIKPSAASADSDEPMHFIYPTDGVIVSLPKQLDGSSGAIHCKVAHSQPSTELFWHLDDQFLGVTRDLHQMQITPTAGHHRLIVVDAHGASITTRIRCVASQTP